MMLAKRLASLVVSVMVLIHNVHLLDKREAASSLYFGFSFPTHSRQLDVNRQNIKIIRVACLSYYFYVSNCILQGFPRAFGIWRKYDGCCCGFLHLAGRLYLLMSFRPVTSNHSRFNKLLTKPSRVVVTMF